MRHNTIVVLGTLTLMIASSLEAQRPSRRGGRSIARPSPPTQSEPEKKEVKKTKVEHWLAIKGADLHLGTGQIIRRGSILVGDDKIHAVGINIEIPEEAKIIDATGKIVSPGFISVKGRQMGAPSSAGGNNHAKDAVNAFDPSIKMGLAAGITSFLANFRGGSSTPDGANAVIKLAWGDTAGMVALEDTVMSMRVPLSPEKMKALRDLADKVKEHRKKVDEHEAEKAKDPKKQPPKPPSGIEKLQKVMDGKARLWILCGSNFTNNAIRQALEIAEIVGHGVVLDNPVTAWSIPDEIAATGSMVILSPRTRVRADPTQPNTTGSNIASAKILDEVGVAVAVHPPGGRFGSGPSLGTGGILGQDLHTLHVDAAYAVRGGLENRKALRSITLDAARIIGAQARIGSIEKGKDADLLILDGDPLHYKTFVQTAIVNGKVVYEKDRETFFGHIKR